MIGRIVPKPELNTLQAADTSPVVLACSAMRAAVFFPAFYIVCDVGNPFVPGAFNFDADDPVEATIQVALDPAH